jgi:hypothetical protein
VSLLEDASDPYEDLAHIGDLQLPKVGRVVRVRVMPDPEHGPGIDVREFLLPSYWDRINAARARAVASGRTLRTVGTANQYVGPLKKGWRLAPFAAEELSELLITAIVRTEALAGS